MVSLSRFGLCGGEFDARSGETLARSVALRGVLGRSLGRSAIGRRRGRERRRVKLMQLGSELVAERGVLERVGERVGANFARGDADVNGVFARRVLFFHKCSQRIAQFATK